jgi:CHAT domain-containing protein
MERLALQRLQVHNESAHTVMVKWSVDDAATGLLMRRFYEEVKAGKATDEALRQAAISVSRMPGYSEPYWWAAFQTIGATSPLFPKPQSRK